MRGTMKLRTGAALAVALCLAGIGWTGTLATGPVRVTSVGTIGITVSDADRAAGFYSRVLSFRQVSDSERPGRAYELLGDMMRARVRVVRMRLGDETIDLTQYRALAGRPFPPDTRSNDRWFQHAAIVVANMDSAYATLVENRVEAASAAPQRLPDWNPNAGGIRAFYFRDPDHHFLEILAYPAGKGDPKWHRPSARLFLGIDHTAIVVRDTTESVKFYRDVLGLRVAGESDNYGIEQERLSNVPGAHVRITSLRAARGPGIELLEYLAPRDGRPLQAELLPRDIAHWETTMSVERPSDGSAPAARPVSPGATGGGTRTAAPGREPLSPEGVLVHDPDGHAVRLVAAGGK